jgi:hypothetical protein
MTDVVKTYIFAAVLAIIIFAFAAVAVVAIVDYDDARTLRMVKACKEFNLNWKGNTCQ